MSMSLTSVVGVFVTATPFAPPFVSRYAVSATSPRNVTSTEYTPVPNAHEPVKPVPLFTTIRTTCDDPLHVELGIGVEPASVYTTPETAIVMSLSSHRTTPGFPPGSLSNASPARFPYVSVNHTYVLVVALAVTLNALVTPLEVVNPTPEISFAGFCAIELDEMDMPVAPFAPTTKLPLSIDVSDMVPAVSNPLIPLFLTF